MRYRLIDLHSDSRLSEKCFEDWISKVFKSKSLHFVIFNDSDRGFYTVVVYGINYFSNHLVDTLSNNRYFSFFGFYMDLKHINVQGTPIRFTFRLR